MTRVDQRVFMARARGDGGNGLGIAGDCMRACLASILDLAYNDVPHVCHHPRGYDVEEDPLADEHGQLWWRRTRRWLRDQDRDVFSTGLACQVDPPRPPIYIVLADGDWEPWEGHVIASGPSPRGRVRHAVVGWYHAEGRGDVIHDPHPSRAGLAGGADAVDVVCDPYDPPPPPARDDPW